MAKVFISYSHDSAEHEERVLRFADAPRRHGIDAELDRYHQRPPQGWPARCEEQLSPEVSSHVPMICTQTDHDRVQNPSTSPFRFATISAVASHSSTSPIPDTNRSTAI